MDTRSFLGGAMLFLTLISCNKADKNLNPKENSAQQDLTLTEKNQVSMEENMLVENKPQVDSVSGITLQGTVPGQHQDWDKKIIKTATLRLEIRDFKSYSDIVHKAAKQYGGYIANEEQNESEGKIEATVSIKVPVDQFESIMNQLPGSAEKIIEKKITTEDVTGEVVDTKSRLQAKEQMRLKYLEFLKQAKNMEDVLKVQSEINEIQEEMESASGRINFLSYQASYSTVNVTFYQPLAGYNPPEEDPGFLTRTAIAFKHGFNFIKETVIGIISIWPLILGGFALWIFVRRRLAFSPTIKQNSKFAE